MDIVTLYEDKLASFFGKSSNMFGYLKIKTMHIKTGHRNRKYIVTEIIMVI